MSTFIERLRLQADRTPELVVIRLQSAGRPDELITYASLVARAAAYAEALRRQGIRPGEVVILILQHGPELIHAFWGSILHGAVPSIMPYLTEKLSPEHYRADLAA